MYKRWTIAYSRTLMCHLREDEDLAKVLEVCFATLLVACVWDSHLLCISCGYTSALLMLCADLCCPAATYQCIHAIWEEYLGPCVKDSLLRNLLDVHRSCLLQLSTLLKPRPGQHADATHHSCLTQNMYMCSGLRYGPVSPKVQHSCQASLQFGPGHLVPCSGRAPCAGSSYQQDPPLHLWLLAVTWVLSCSNIMQHSRQPCCRTFAP